MSLYDTLRMAVQNLAQNRMRSLLAMLGIVIGIFGVIVMGMVGVNGKKIIFEEIKTFGLQTVWVYRNFKSLSPYDIDKESGILASDVDSITRSTRHIKHITPVIQQEQWVSNSGKMSRVQVMYVTPAYFRIENDSLISGRFFTELDVRLSRRVCMISQGIYQDLYAKELCLGQSLDIGNISYTIVGILHKKERGILQSIGVGGGLDPNMRVILPLSIALNSTENQQVDYLELAALSTEVSNKAADDVINTLNRIHHRQFSYSKTAMKTYIDAFNHISAIVSLILIVAVAIALIVGGIGIANVMTISVVERTKEIGIRQAMGATANDIFKLFLMESVLLTSSAGVIGVCLGGIVGFIGQLIFPKSFVFPLSFAIFGLVVAVITGLASGVYPAIAAAKKKPIEALRYE